MKKNSTVKSFMLKAVEKIAVKSTETSANSACYFWQYQPKESAKVKKNEKILILILDQPIDKLSAIISSFCVKLPCQATACLRSLSLTELILSVDFVYRTIEN